MNVLEAIKERRSVKHFDPEYKLSLDEQERIIELAMLSPTAFNIQHWRFVVVNDPMLRKEIRAAAWDQSQVTDASMLTIMCADLKAWEKDPKRYWRNANKQVQDFMLPGIEQYYADKPVVQRDEAFRSAGIAAQTLMLAAKGMELDSCPMDGFDFDKVGELINLPKDHVIVMFVAIGKAIKEANPRGGQLDLSEVMVENRFS
jgi:nitroreductase